MKPIRVQRKRIKGFKLPENTVCVTRGTKYGNPFKIGNYYRYSAVGWSTPCAPDTINEAKTDGKHVYIASNEDAVFHYEKYVNGLMFKNSYEDIKGKNLACFCRLDQSCHADVLLKLANPETDE